MKHIKITLVLSTLAVFLIACANTENPTPETNQSAANSTSENTASDQKPAEMASGAKIFADTCSKCHQSDGTGGRVDINGKTIKAANLTGEHAKKEPDEELIEHITDGIPDDGMPSFKDKLSPEEIRQVVKYIREEFQKS